MKGRLAWAFGGFVLVALVVYRFLTRVPAPAAGAAPLSAAVPGLTVVPDAGASGSDLDEELDGDPDEAPGDPDERVEALRRTLEAARDAPAPPEPARAAPAPPEPALDDRRRSVHDAGRAAAEQMRRAAERPPRGDPA